MNLCRSVRAAAALALLLSGVGAAPVAWGDNAIPREGISNHPGVPRQVARGSGVHWTAPAPIADGELNEYPDVAVDGRGTAWVTWVGMVSGVEHVFVRGYHGVEPGRPIDVGFAGGLQFSPRIVASGNRVWVAWSCKRPGESRSRWKVVAREIQSGIPGSVATLSGPSEDALRPALGLDLEGRPWVAWESRVGSRFRVVARPVETPGALARTWIVSSGGELDLRPAVVPAGKRSVYVVWDSYADGEYQVMLRRVGPDGIEPAIRVSTERAFNIGAAAAVDRDGNVYVAYASNADAAGRQRVGKSLRVRVLHRGAVVDLAGGQPPRIATAPGRLDAIEFPTIHLDPAGRLWVFARRGQGFIAFRYEGERWFPPLDLSVRGWGGRGKDLRAAWSPQGFHLVARRLHILAHQLFIPPAGTAPPMSFAPAVELVTAGVDARDSVRLAGAAAPRIEPRAEIVEQTVLASIHFSDTFLWRPDQPWAWAAADGRPDVSRFFGTGSSLEPGQSGGMAAFPFRRPGVAVPAGMAVRAEGASIPPGPPRVLADGVGPPRARLPSSIYDYKEDLDQVALPRPRAAGFYFGDLHTHSWMSDGAGDPDEVYTRSRDRYRFDLVALTDHGNENGNLLLPSEWEYLQLMADFFYRPGKFVTFVAYEWTSNVYPRGGGHRNVYYPGDRGNLLDAVYAADNTMTLFELLKTQGAIAVPHHIGWTGTDWEHHDPDVQRLAEIISVHGAFEKPGNRPILPRHEMAGMFIRDGLSRGLRFGLVGGSDGHGYPWHYGVSRKEDIWRTGLTGIVAPALTRLSLFNALHNRLTVATSGAPISIWMTVNGAPMGSELVLHRPPRFDIRVEGSAPIRVLVVVRDGEDVQRFRGDGKVLSLTLVDRPPPGQHYYYLRVVQEDNEVAWASPVWVEMKGRMLIGPPDP